MDSQQAPRPPGEPTAAAQNAASVIGVKPAQTGFAATSNGPLDGFARLPLQQQQQQQFPGARPPPPYGPVPRHPFFGRPPQPGQGPRFAPPRPPPAGYGPQAFPHARPPFPPGAALHRSDSLGGPIPLPEQRFLRPQFPQQQQHQQPPLDRRTLLRPQSSFDAGRMQASEQPARPASAIDNDRDKDKLPGPQTETHAQLQPDPRVDVVRLEQQPAKDDDKASGSESSSSSSRAQSATDASQAKTKLEAPASRRGSVVADLVPPKTPLPSTEVTSSIQGFDEGRRKSLTSPAEPKEQASQPSVQGEDSGDTSGTHPIQTTPVAAASTAESRATTVATAADKPVPTRLNIKKSPSARSIKQDAENDSGVDESTQRREAPKSNGVSSRTPSKTRDADKRSAAGSPVKSPNKSIKSLPRTPDAAPSAAEKKKVPMNKVQVGAAPSPNLKAVRSKIGSLENATHKPGGGKIKIENRKLDFSSAQPKIAAKNDKYVPSGGDKKIEQVKLQWNAKPKIGSLDNATYKPGGGNKKIESVKLDFKDKAKPKVGSKENAKHVPGGGSIKSSATTPKTPQDSIGNIESQKLDFKAESKVGSMDNMKHKPGGGDKKIFDDKSYLRQSSSNVGSVSGSGSQPLLPTPTRSRNPISPCTSIAPGFVKTPEISSAGKKPLPASPRKNNTTKEMPLPKLSPLNSNHIATSETHKAKQTRVPLPIL